MAENTKIEWTDHTFNPWEGCQKVGPGCDNCYAETRNARFAGGQAVNWGPGAPRRMTSAGYWNKPLTWNANHEAFFAEHGRRQRVFCASLADVFDNAVNPSWRIDLFGLILKTPHLDWLLLTKRIGNVKPMLADLAHGSDPDLSLLDMMPLPNVWIGATVVNQEEADRDIPKLLAVPAKVRFLSMEPLLAPVDLEHACDLAEKEVCKGTWKELADPYICAASLRHGSVAMLDWVIVGGESGPGARPMHPDWARSLRDQCEDAGTDFLFKQWGEWMPGEKDGDTVKLSFPAAGPHGPANPEFYDWPDGVCAARVGKKAAGRLLDGRTWDEIPQA
ncbi:phage Gp37/Gp68 family protein [Comamonas sp. Z1]|uniref:phage Gp37/Gp68 family protein n=1 Tax=Comamonas sp. Z1 TaxID=2601246 RepID=UPI0011E6AFEA|nr:phage Gp37/Gp68 family protein [Comamonas sp. Z1]TYK74315.1 phage Gp37/Gp68 family protein [Comamonas sp. Z1]